MRFLVDRCVGVRLAEWLRQEGHDVVESRELGADPGDRALLQYAATEKRILITIDQDFGEIVFTLNAPHCGIVRLPDVRAARRIALIQTVLATYGDELLTGAIVTVRGGRIRISRYP